MLKEVVTTAMCSGVLDEVVGLLPIIVPVSVGFIGLRKGLSFLFGSLRKA